MQLQHPTVYTASFAHSGSDYNSTEASVVGYGGSGGSWRGSDGGNYDGSSRLTSPSSKASAWWAPTSGGQT